MKYKVELYSPHYDILSGVVFDNKYEAFIHIGEVLTRYTTVIEVAIEKIYSREDNKKLALIIYRLYERK